MMLLQRNLTRARAELDRRAVERRKLLLRLAHQSRLVTLGRSIAELSHELRSPLQRVSAVIDLADISPPERHAHLFEQARAAVDEMTARMAAMLGDARVGDDGECAPRGAIDHALSLLPAEQRARVIVSNPAVLTPAAIGSSALGQVVHNLVANALRCGDGVWVEVSAGEGALQVEVHDDGPGVPVDQRGAIFEPFTSTRTDRDGAGLGLSVVRRLLQDAQGQVIVADSPRGGARFLVQVPLVRSEHARAA
jgi:signal transduction histidine kinase